MKLIEVWFHHIQELVTKKKLEFWKINTEVNIADCLTKPLPKQCFGALRTMTGLRQATELMRVERGLEERSRKTQGTEETTLSEDTDRRGNDREVNKLGYKMRI